MHIRTSLGWLSPILLAAGIVVTAPAIAQFPIPSPTDDQRLEVDSDVEANSDIETNSDEPAIEVEKLSQPDDEIDFRPVIADPPTLSIMGVLGKTATRSLTLQFAQPPETIDIHLFDLESTDNTRTYSAQAIQCGQNVTCESWPLPKTRRFITIPFHFDLKSSQNYEVKSGQFTGKMIITADDQEMVIPITIHIKEDWPLPILLLLSGVVMGMAVSAYSGGGKLSDEVTVGLNRLQSQIDQYRESAQFFAVRAEMYIADARLANEAKQLEEARNAVSMAKEIWRKWYRQRTEWENQFVYQGTLMKQVKDELTETQSLYVLAINRELEDVIRITPEDFAEPGELRACLREIAKKLRDYGQIKSRWHQLRERVNKEFSSLPAHERKELNDQVSSLEQEFNALAPSGPEALKALKKKINVMIQTIKLASETTQLPFDAAQSKAPSDATETSATKPRSTSGLTLIPEPSEVSAPTPTPAMQQADPLLIRLCSRLWPDADGRLRGFYVLSYVISVVVLASGGFNELYVAKPAFGANRWGDYFSLLAWGFGAEATRNTVTKVVRKTDEAKD